VKRFTIFITVVNFVFLFLLWLCPFWPRELWWLVNLIQISPLYLLFVPLFLIFVPVFYFHLWKMLLLQLLSLLILLFGVMGFQFNIASSEWIASRSDTNIRVLSMNIGKDREVGIRFNYEKFIQLVKDTKPDIIALQEAGNPSLLKMIKDAFPGDTWYGSFKEGFSIVSKMEINDQEMDWNGRRGAIRRYQIKDKDHVITFFNVHFMTPRSGFEALLTNGFSGIDKMKEITAVQRKEASMASRIIGLNANIIIAGDFNMSSIHPIYRKNWSKFLDAFSQRGFGFGYTKYLLFHGVRIDHILSNSNWKIINAMVGPSLDCDHRPLIVDLKFIGQSGGDTMTKKSPAKGENEYILNNLDLFHYENFETDTGDFESYGTGKLIIDYENTYSRGNSLKVKGRPGSENLKAGIEFNLWNLEKYEILSFSYKIPKKTPVCVKVKTRFNDWLCLGGTMASQCRDINGDTFIRLIDDNQWHEIDINVNNLVKSVLPALNYLLEFQFTIDQAFNEKNFFWIDDFRITGGI